MRISSHIKSAILSVMLTAALSVPGMTAAHAMKWTDWVPLGSIEPLGPGMPPASAYIPGALDDYYSWYCDLTTAKCPPGSDFSRVQFRLTFEFTEDDGSRVSEFGFMHLVADDYFALYINDQLIGESWLDDKNAASTFIKLEDYMLLDQINVVDVFACDGYKSTASAGATTAGGFDACTDASSRVNHWFLASGYYEIYSAGGDGPFLQGVNFNSGDPSNWQVRALVNEPASLALLGLGLAGLGLSRRRKAA